MTPQELDANCQKPGVEGCMWRLAKTWDPDKVGLWMQHEMLRGTHPHEAAHALAEVVSAVIFGFGVKSDNPREAIVGPKGVVAALNRSCKPRSPATSPGRPRAASFCRIGVPS